MCFTQMNFVSLVLRISYSYDKLNYLDEIYGLGSNQPVNSSGRVKNVCKQVIFTKKGLCLTNNLHCKHRSPFLLTIEGISRSKVGNKKGENWTYKKKFASWKNENPLWYNMRSEQENVRQIQFIANPGLWFFYSRDSVPC